MSFLQAQIAQLIQLAKKKSEEEPYYEVLKVAHLTGKQYFNTGIQTSDNLTFECGFKLTSASNVSNGIFGGRHNTGRTQGNSTVWTGYEVRRVGSSTYTQVINRTRIGQVTTSQNIAINTFYDMEFLPTSLQLNNTSITLEQGTSIEQPVDIYLGAINNDDTPAVPMTGDLTYFKIFDNGVLVSDCVPALNDKLEVCMYDKVRKILIKYTNISGETEAPTFERWNKYDVDYIENTGTTYIPFADITPTTTMGMNIEYAYTVLSSSEPAGVIGTYNGDTQRKDTFFVSTSSGSTQKASSPSSASCGVMVFHRGGNVGTSSSSSASYIEPEKDVWYKATVNWLGDDEVTWTDGTNELSTSVGANPIMTNQLRLFSRYNGNSSGTGAGTYNNCKARVRKLQFSDGTTIIRSYKPSVRIYNDGTSVVTKAFLYDEVYNKAYDSAGTGSLKACIIGYGNTFTRTGETTGKFIDANGDIQTNSNSAYSVLLPIKGGETVTCVSGTATGNNYRYHVYDSGGTWIEQALVLNPSTTTAITDSFVAPSNASYVRVSYANANTSNNIEVNSSLATYEVGKSVSGTPSSSVSGVSNCFDTGLYGTQDTTVKHIAIGYDNPTSSGQLFGSYDGTTSTSKNLTINSTGTGSTAPIRFDGQSTTTPIKIPINQSASIVTNRYGLWVDNTLRGSWGDVNDFTTLTTLLILKCNNSTNVRNNGCCYCSILEKDVPVAEYIPVRNANNTSVYGLYDRVSKTLNTGSGTINFNVLD